MKVVIADDEPLARSLLRSLLDDVGDIDIVGEARNGREAVAQAERLRPDAVFLDIDMPGGGGLDAAHDLQAISEVVFVTAHEMHALDAFELGAADYLLKPVRRPRLAKALGRVRARIREKACRHTSSEEIAEAAFWVRSRQGTVRVNVADILWIEASRDHVYLHTPGKSHLHRITMAELGEKLRGTGIVRVQRSAFVRLDRVATLLRRNKSVVLELEDGSQVPVGPTYQAETLRLLGSLEQQPASSRSGRIAN